MLTMAQQLAPNDPIGAIGCANQALVYVEALRARATLSSGLLGAVLFYGVDLEVRLRGLSDLPGASLLPAINKELDRCDQLTAAIASHIDRD